MMLKSRVLWNGTRFLLSPASSSWRRGLASKSMTDDSHLHHQEVIKSLNSEEEQEIVTKLKNQLDSQSKTLGTVPVFKRALLYGNSVAIKDQNGEFSYAMLYMGAKKLSLDISNICGKKMCLTQQT